MEEFFTISDITTQNIDEVVGQFEDDSMYDYINAKRENIQYTANDTEQLNEQLITLKNRIKLLQNSLWDQNDFAVYDNNDNEIINELVNNIITNNVFRLKSNSMIADNVEASKRIDYVEAKLTEVKTYLLIESNKASIASKLDVLYNII